MKRNHHHTLLRAKGNHNTVLLEHPAQARASTCTADGYRSPCCARSRLGFNGQYLERDGMQIPGSYRAFNPELMRFHSPDSLSPFDKGGLNAYAYCQGDPINHVDPTGHFPLLAAAAVSVLVRLPVLLTLASLATVIAMPLLPRAKTKLAPTITLAVLTLSSAVGFLVPLTAGPGFMWGFYAKASRWLKPRRLGAQWRARHPPVVTPRPLLVQTRWRNPQVQPEAASRPLPTYEEAIARPPDYEWPPSYAWAMSSKNHEARLAAQRHPALYNQSKWDLYSTRGQSSPASIRSTRP